MKVHLSICPQLIRLLALCRTSDKSFSVVLITRRREAVNADDSMVLGIITKFVDKIF